MTYATHTSHDAPRLKHTRWLPLLMFTTAFALALACGSSDSSDDAAAPASGGEGVDDALSEVSITMLADQTFTFEDYVAAGWKKNKQFPTDTVPDASYDFSGHRSRRYEVGAIPADSLSDFKRRGSLGGGAQTALLLRLRQTRSPGDVRVTKIRAKPFPSR